ncbi:hypothetical protein HPB49_002199 [Dermacentor silvarum]|uniref:Uncharacterized protein n=1 Tax=Dermacentor silvarum TaxID=543639 RepID=A0ACB8D2E9_DERSI|nr:hypothetical protein HPB49_002199 [Dermacentor silvarum]
MVPPTVQTLKAVPPFIPANGNEWWHFPQHRYSKFRIATLHMFCKDYAVLNDIIYFRELMGMPPKEWRCCVWVHQVCEELHNIVKLNKLARFRLSYFPYMRVLNIISRSPLSVSASPNTHTFMQSGPSKESSAQGTHA